MLIACFGALACGPSNPCPEGYRDVRGACTPLDAGTLPQCEPTGSYEGFGDACEGGEGDAGADGDCACPAPICADDLGGYCTQLNCLEDPTLCPPDWTCFDLRGFPDVPENVDSICMR
jgi:hypothetical protein